MTTTPSPIGAELRWMRTAAGKSGPQMGIILDYAASTVSRWETGNRRPPEKDIERWRLRCTSIIRARVNRETEKAVRNYLLACLERIESPRYLKHLDRLRLTRPQQGPPLVLIPMDSERLTAAMLATWQERAAAGIEGTPEEQCRALADAVVATAIEC